MADRLTDALRPPQAALATPDPNAGRPDQGDPGDGTPMSGYATPDKGPFQCDHCQHFQPPSSCDHPQVTNDPQVQGQVAPAGCCNFFKSAGKPPDLGPARTGNPQAGYGD